MNYRHIYHAGNICDVVKHSVFLLILSYLQQKEGGLAVMDTHAGCGLYDLDDPRPQKTKEFSTGLQKLWESRAALPALLSPYMALVERLNPDQVLRAAPGSSYLAAAMLRPQDRLIACELHPEDAGALRRNLRGFERTQLHHRDGYEALDALTPFPEKRGLILIDPPFEQPDEHDALVRALLHLRRKAPATVVAAWYPIKDRPALWAFHDKLAQAGGGAVSISEFIYRPETRHDRLNGSGYVFMNAPWVLKEQLATLYPALHALLGTDAQDNVTLKSL